MTDALILFVWLMIENVKEGVVTATKIVGVVLARLLRMSRIVCGGNEDHSVPCEFLPLLECPSCDSCLGRSEQSNRKAESPSLVKATERAISIYLSSTEGLL